MLVNRCASHRVCWSTTCAGRPLRQPSGVLVDHCVGHCHVWHVLVDHHTSHRVFWSTASPAIWFAGRPLRRSLSCLACAGRPSRQPSGVLVDHLRWSTASQAIWCAGRPLRWSWSCLVCVGFSLSWQLSVTLSTRSRQRLCLSVSSW